MKFIESYFDKETKESTVIVEHMGVQFIGKAKLHPEDSDRCSELVGGRYAEMRATIKALKYERNIEKQKCEECRKFVKACSQYRNFDKDSQTAKLMYRQLNKRIKRVNALADEINVLYEGIITDVAKRDKLLNKINNKSE